MENTVILVDTDDNELGTCEKMKAHVEGLLHRAFSVFVFNKNNELLLQKRAISKYHSGGLWTNTVCSHPKPGEDFPVSIANRMIEEMGFSTEATWLYSFHYRSDYENGVNEHEIDHVFVGHYDADPIPNPEEVEDFRWIKLIDLIKEVESNPEHFTTWFRHILKNEKFLGYMREQNLFQ